MTDKLYYSIGEVSKMLDVNPSVLRFWETEIPDVRPHKNAKGTRQYTADDIALLKHIYHLTRDCGYTLDGVKEQLRHKETLDHDMQLVQTLTEARQFLVSLKKTLTFVVLSIWTVGLWAQTPESYWQEFASVRYKNLSEVSYTLIHKRHFPEVEYVDTAYVEADINAVVFLRNDGNNLKVGKDSLWLVDNENANISYGPREYDPSHYLNGNMYNYIRDRYQCGLIKYAPFHLHPSDISLYATTDSIYETVVAGTPYHVMTQHLLTGMQYNEETKEFDIPLTDYISLYCNDRTHWVDKVKVHTNNDTSAYTEYTFQDIQPFKQRQVRAELFDIHAPQYNKYAKYDFVQAAAPSIIGIGSRDTTVTDELLDYPLEGYNGDTAYLRQEKGWVMLEFWQYGCKPCVKFLMQLEQEKESLGFRQLDKEGVKLFCIYPKGGITPAFKQHADRYKAQDILYAARGISSLLSVRYYPIYYLFSPSRELVFRGGPETEEDDIVEMLLKAKREYEAKQTGARTKH